MSTGAPLILATSSSGPSADLRESLETSGELFQPCSFDGLPSDELGFFSVAVVDAGDAVDDPTRFARRWRGVRGETAPLIWVANNSASRTAGWTCGADAVIARPCLPADLAGALAAVRRQQTLRQRLLSSTAEAHAISQTALEFYQRTDIDARLARRIQRSCRPAQMPKLEGARFSVSHRSHSGSGGDFYHVGRADETHVAFFLGDVMGSSVTAALLSIVVHQAIVPKIIGADGYRLVPPDDVLRRVNRELLGLGLPDPPLVRLTYGLLDAKSGKLDWACAGHTPPLLLPADGPADFWRSQESMLGTMEVAPTLRTAELARGDRVLVFTDGLHGTSPDTLADLQAVAVERRSLPLAALAEALTQELLTRTAEPDDFTLLAMEWTG